MDDPRKHKRLPIALTYSLRCPGEPAPVQATLLDISYGGMGIVTAKELPLGTIVDFLFSDFPCAPADQATCKCRIISVRSVRGSTDQFRTGLAFETPDPAFIQNLLQWVQNQAQANKSNLRHGGDQR